MPKVIEPLNGGMVTSRDPSMLAQGETQLAKNCLYYQDNEHLGRVPGVSAWNTTTNHLINGLASCRFADGTNKLLAQIKATADNTVTYRLANAETNNSSLSVAVTGLTGSERIVTTQADNRHYVFNGVDDNLVLLKDGTFRPHGLKPAVDGGISFYRWMNNAAPNAGFEESPAAVGAEGYYEYWYTESLTFSDGQVLESTFTKKPLTINVTSLAHAPVFNLPNNPQNADYSAKYNAKLHFNIYRSEKKTAINDQLYPIGRKVGEASWVDTAGDSIARPIFRDTASTTNTGVKYALTAIGQYTQKTYRSGSGANNYTILEGVQSNLDVSNDSITDVLDTAGDAFLRVRRVNYGTGCDVSPKSWAIGLRNFQFGAFDGNIIGINVSVVARASHANCATMVVLPMAYQNDTNTWQAIPAEGGSPSYIHGIIGQKDWGQSTIDVDIHGDHVQGEIGGKSAQSKVIDTTSFTTYNFGQLNTATNAPAFISYPYTWKLSSVNNMFGVAIGINFNSFPAAGTSTFVDIDSVSMSIYYSGHGSEDDSLKDKSGQFYDAVVVEQEGVQVAFGARNKGPIASTGAMFQGSLVTDSKDEPTKIYYSLPGFPDAFPKEVYWLELPGVNNDKITSINVINDRLLVGTRGSLWRINYLPSQDDAGFARGEAISLVSDSVGIVNQSASCTFTNQNGQQELAFVDANGIFSTDGYAIRKLSQDLLWIGPSAKSVSSPTSLAAIYDSVRGLVTDPRTQTIRLLTYSAGWAGSYAAIHAKPGGGLKWTRYGTTDGAGFANCIHCIRRENGTWIIVYGMTSGSGKIYREDSSDSTTYNDPMDGQYPIITTREISFGNFSGESSMDSIGIHGTMRTSPSSAAFTNISAQVTTTQRFTNAGVAAAAEATIPGNVAGSRNSMAGIDGVNCEEVSISLTLSELKMFELHGIHMNVSDFGEVDTRA
jgi:hypothetical protein